MNKGNALILINLGTPDAATVPAVKRYLRQFLSDPLVIDIPGPLRWLLVNAIIVPFRAKKSTEAYKKIWQEGDSPLRQHSLNLDQQVQDVLGEEFAVYLAMRYGRPSIESVFKEIKNSNYSKIYILPLYPQYALSSTQSSVDECQNWIRHLELKAEVLYLPDFYMQKDFINCFAKNCENTMNKFKPDFLLFSFHGLPLRHCFKAVGNSLICKQSSCCETVEAKNRKCYRAQCFATANSIANQLGLKNSQWKVSFQSRLGQTEWINPYTDQVIVDLARQGIKKLAIVCPSFVADCLETLEEIAIRAQEDFINAGGKELVLIPSLNSSSQWAKSIGEFLTTEDWLSL